MKYTKTLGTLILAFSAPAVFAQTTAEPATQPFWSDSPNMALAAVAFVLLIAIMSVVVILRKLTSNAEYFTKLRELKSKGTAKAIGIIVVLGGVSNSLYAQSEEAVRPPVAEFPNFFSDPNTVLLLLLNLLLLGAFIYVIRVLLKTVGMLMPETEAAPVEEVDVETKILHALTDAVPVEQEHEIMLDHEYDGIRELDNNLPPWWVWMFYTTIIWSFVYLVYYHVLPYGLSQSEEYVAEVEQAEADKAAFLAMAKDRVDENTVEILTGESDLAAGKAIYVANCQQCHAADGGGGVGPNFTDEYWLHGGGIKNIFSTVKYGVPAKGMIAWESQLRPVQMAQVASYILTLQGTTPAEPKEPQGEIWVAPEVETAPADSTVTESDLGEEQSDDTEMTDPEPSES